MADVGTSRAERRRRTEQRILTAARRLFGERGFERTTIRAVAAAAGVDPALVMQYFGSKQQLFALALRLGETEPAVGDAQELTAILLQTLDMKLAGLPEPSLAAAAGDRIATRRPSHVRSPRTCGPSWRT